MKFFETPSADTLSGASLAYLGDAVLELLTRQYLLSLGKTDVGKMNSLALSYVKATAQSDAVEKILPVLSEEELAVFKRGRNSHGIAIPKSAKAGQYRRATGFEALFAYLYINGKEERMKELFLLGFSSDKSDVQIQ
ncbi:MAG: ribonuclease III [Clostridia bacterium]|nr:ribonuclease III [Clostridia bacterium]